MPVNFLDDLIPQEKLQWVSEDANTSGQLQCLTTTIEPTLTPPLLSPTAEEPASLLNGHEKPRLLRYYKTVMCKWFDCCDPSKHWSTTILELAETCLPLKNAILAVASKHLSLIGNMDESVTLHYQSLAFRELLPALSSSAYELDMLAAVALLRFIVQMTG